MSQYIKIKYHTDFPEDQKVKMIAKGDWIDLRAAEDVHMNFLEHRYISLGVSMKIPPNCEAHLLPRSSTYKNFGIIVANSMGVIDESYCGENDVWKLSAIALRETDIHKGDRIAQFRVIEKMHKVEFIEVEEMEDEDRGGFGSTGKV